MAKLKEIIDNLNSTGECNIVTNTNDEQFDIIYLTCYLLRDIRSLRVTTGSHGYTKHYIDFLHYYDSEQELYRVLPAIIDKVNTYFKENNIKLIYLDLEKESNDEVYFGNQEDYLTNPDGSRS